MTENMSGDPARSQLLAQVRQYAENSSRPTPFRPGIDPIPVSGKVIGADEIVNMVDASLEAWLTTGRFNDRFEQELARYIGIAGARTVNSGSSANLVALATLCSPSLDERVLRPGDEVITVAAGFPTTVNPALLYGLVPVFVDISLPTYNIDVGMLEAALSPRTRAIMLAHTLGNPFDLDAVTAFARKHDLWLIEDCCDAQQSGFVGEEGAAFAHGDVVGRIEAERAEVAEGADVAAAPGGAQRVAAVLDQP